MMGGASRYSLWAYGEDEGACVASQDTEYSNEYIKEPIVSPNVCLDVHEAN